MMSAEEAYRRACGANLPHLPLFEGARAGHYELTILSSPQIAWPSIINRSLRPRVVLLGDDPWPAGESLGPDGWACARAAKRWARAAIVHGTGPHPDHYRLAGQATVFHRYVLMVECASAQVEAWAAFLNNERTLRFLPPEGCVHPHRNSCVVH